MAYKKLEIDLEANAPKVTVWAPSEWMSGALFCVALFTRLEDAEAFVTLVSGAE